jgi:two-component system LytT family response regulator
MSVRALIVEDEPPARHALAGYVGRIAWLELVGEAADGIAAVQAIDGLRPDLVFLDVRMPGLDGLSVLRRVRHTPEVVFTTAYDRYAVTAFELGAVDYLVKPFGWQRFERALERARSRLESKPLAPNAGERVGDALEGRVLRRLFTRVGGQIVPVTLESVVRLEARGDYVAIHRPEGTSLMHVTLTELESRLDPERFFRVHRSHVVNLDHVKSVQRCDERRYAVVLSDGTELVASRAGSLRLASRLR